MTTHTSAVLSLHLSQCFTPVLKPIPASFLHHIPCQPSWILSLPAILAPVLRMCHLFRTTYATLGAGLSIDPIWWGNFLRRGNPLKGGRTLGAWVWSLADLVLGKSVRCAYGYLPMGRCHFLTGCVLFWEMEPVFFGWERVNPLVWKKIRPVYVVPVGIHLLVVVKKENHIASWRCLRWLGSILRVTPHGFCRHWWFRSCTSPWTIGEDSDSWVCLEESTPVRGLWI